VLKARGVISHDILHPIDEGDFRAVTMVVLVEAGDLAEVGGWSAGSGAAFEVASQSGSVVHQVGDSCPSSVIGFGNAVRLDYHGSLFKVAIGDVARWVLARH